MPPQGAPGGPEGAQPTGKYSRGRLNTPQRGHGGGPGGRGGRMVTKPKDTKKTIARLVTYVTHDKLKIAFIFFLVILSSVTRVGATYITRPIVNTLTQLRDDPMLRVKQPAVNTARLSIIAPRRWTLPINAPLPPPTMPNDNFMGKPPLKYKKTMV